MSDTDWIESEEFYTAMQGYRRAPPDDQREVIAHFENVKALVRENFGAQAAPQAVPAASLEELMRLVDEFARRHYISVNYPGVTTTWGRQMEAKAAIEACARALTSPAVPAELLEGAMQFAGNRSMAVSSEWVRGWDDCLGYVRMVLASPAVPAAEPARKPVLYCQNCGLCRITGTGPCDECGGDDFKAATDPASREAISAAILAASTAVPAVAEGVSRKPVAYVPIHPRTGPLWANTIPTLEHDRPASYPTMALYDTPPPSEPPAPAAEAVSREPLPDVLFDGNRVYWSLTPVASRRTSPESVSDVLEAVVRILRATPPQPQAEPASPSDLPLFPAGVAAQKWTTLQTQGYRMRSLAFEGNGRAGKINAYGKVEWQAEAAGRARQLVDTQAEDDGLWFVAENTSEAYLQRALRELHAAVTGEPIPQLRQEAAGSPPAPVAGGDAKPLTEKQIEEGWRETFSTNNPFCPCDLKTFKKAARWAEAEVRRAAMAAAPPTLKGSGEAG